MQTIPVRVTPSIQKELYLPRHMSYGEDGVTGCRYASIYTAYSPKLLKDKREEILSEMSVYNKIIDQVWSIPEFPDYFTQRGLCVGLEEIKQKFGDECADLVQSIKSPRYCCADLFCRSGYFMCSDTAMKATFEFDDQSFEFNMLRGACEFFAKGKNDYSYSWREEESDLYYAMADKFYTDGVIQNDYLLTVLGYQVTDGTNGTSMQKAMKYLITLMKNRGYLEVYSLSPEDYIELWNGYTGKKNGTVEFTVLNPKYKKDKLLCERIRCLTDAFNVDEDGELIKSNILYDPAIKDINLEIPFYFLQDKNDKMYISRTPGQFGGHKKQRIYGKMNCRSANRYIANGQYVQHRVFFADQETAIAAGYRPCGVCMKEEYKKWKEQQTLK